MSLAEILIGRSRETIVWMRSHGVRFLPMFGRQSYQVEGQAPFLRWGQYRGGGRRLGLVDALIQARGEARHRDPLRDGAARAACRIARTGNVTGARVKGPRTATRRSPLNPSVLACGGFEANPEMRTRYFGPGWELCRVRGTRHNTGGGIRAALDIGAQPFGGWSTCHAVQWDISAPPFGDRVVLDNFQKHSYPIGIVVNLKGERFIDEGADYRNHTYAKYGREVMKQPRRTAVQIFDAKTIGMVRDEYRIKQVSKFAADSLEELATGLDIDPRGLVRTVNVFNSACRPGNYNPSVLDGVKTVGIAPPKSNWGRSRLSSNYDSDTCFGQTSSTLHQKTILAVSTCSCGRCRRMPCLPSGLSPADQLVPTSAAGGRSSTSSGLQTASWNLRDRLRGGSPPGVLHCTLTAEPEPCREAAASPGR